MNKFRKTLIAGWTAGLLGLTVLVILLWDRSAINHRIEAGWTDVAGRPCLLLVCGDFPGFWSRFEKTPAGMSLRENAPFVIDTPLLILRQTVGIRFTPLRWRLWMGRRAAFGWFPDDGTWLLAAEGGILSRLAGKYLWGPSRNPAPGVMHAPSTIIRIAPDGELYLVHGLDEPAEKQLKKIKNNIKKLKINFDLDLAGTFNGVWNNAPPWIRTETLSQPDRSVSDVLHDDPVFFIHGDSLAFLLSADRILNGTALPEWIISIFKYELIGFYFFGLKIEQGVPVPDLLLAARGNETFPPALSRMPVRERVFGNHPGWQLDVLPPWLQMYGVSIGDRHYMATVAARLADLLDQPEPDAAETMAGREEACLEVRIQWPLLARSARQLLQFMADQQTVPGISDPRELALHWFPLIRWLETLGGADLACYPASGGAWQIRGHLWNPPETDS